MTDPTEPDDNTLINTYVASGACWLDVEKPGWADLVDLDTLNMACGGSCILGQVFGDYYRATCRVIPSGELDWDDPEWDRLDVIRSAWGHSHGFFHPETSRHAEYVVLGYVAAWKYEIDKRVSVTPPEGTAVHVAALAGAEV